MKTFKTPGGLELPLLDLRGKDYLQVAYRIQWFRETHSEFGIQTEIKEVSDKRCIVKAQITKPFFMKQDLNTTEIYSCEKHILSEAHGQESVNDFQDYIEKAETKAIGRALANLGFGTQFALELDEGERIVDSPQISIKQIPNKAPGTDSAKPQMNGSWGGYTLKTGKNKTKTLRSVGVGQAIAYQSFIEGLKAKGESIAKSLEDDFQAIIEFRKQAASENAPKSNNPGDFEPPAFEDLEKIPF